jgi:hypothetical protein
MTLEIGTTAPAAADDLSAAKLAFLDAVRKGEAGLPLLKKILGTTKLSPEQQAFVDILAELDAAPGEDDEEDDSGEPVSAMKRELADLREANDTVAAALGACRYCWGGDRNCQACRGRGRSGYRPPDPDLFNELVMPAVHRAREMKRTAIRQRSGRMRV